MKKTKKKHRLRSYLVILLFLYLVAMFSYYVFTLSIKNIYVLGTTYLSDLEVIEAAGLKDYPSMLKTKSSKIKKNLKKLSQITDVKVKKSISGKVTLQITEARPLFYYRNDDKIYLDNLKKIDNKEFILGLPVLINYVPQNILKQFINKFKKIDQNIILMINEIEYTKEEKDNVTIDDTRFIFRMNDTNTVYVNIINLERINSYDKIYATLTEGVHGTLYLNSNRDNVSFTSYEVSQAIEEKEKQTEGADVTNEN